MSSPNIASKRWVYEQYDTTVRTSTAVPPGSSAGVVRIRKTNKALAMATDCNGRFCYLEPREGAKIAVSEAALNVAASGGKPVGITNCLNFGNPYDPEIYYQFAECVAGMGEACRMYDTPVTGGNVSFYNEDPERAVYPTPVIGMVGVIDDVSHITTIDFKEEMNDIYLIGETKDEIGGTEYLKEIHGKITGKIPRVDLDNHKNTIELLLELINNGLINSAQDISDGGLAVALAECCFRNDIGASIKLDSDLRADSLLFGESQSRVIISAKSDNLKEIKAMAKKFDITINKIGTTGGCDLKINDVIELPISTLKYNYESAIPSAMEVISKE
jgi:phosphoribosylformylglycinamidine synthase